MVTMDSSFAPPGHLTTRQVAQLLGVEPGGVRQIVHRGQLSRSGGSPRHPWYAVEDVTALAAKRAARKAA
jgi:plasmid maintenance system antidote protein VapI